MHREEESSDIVCILFIILGNIHQQQLRNMEVWRFKCFYPPEIDSRRLRPKSVGCAAEIVTTECLRVLPATLDRCVNVVRNSTSCGLKAPVVSPPTSDKRLT
uniref:Uncharacterized protein n=1 Tax=Glossina austeni TaxID=7395 RepID=A0A1A9VNG4_GLOAU